MRAGVGQRTLWAVLALATVLAPAARAQLPALKVSDNHRFLVDSEGRLDLLKGRVAKYPDALRQAVVQDYLWMAEFGLTAFARKYAARSDSYGTAACLASAVNQMVLALFSLNRKYPINDKTALAETTEFHSAPREFGPRVQQILGKLGGSSAELASAVNGVEELLREKGFQALTVQDIAALSPL